MENSNKEKILVTGGTGLAGRYAIKKLVSKGYAVYALVRNKDKLVKTVCRDGDCSNLKVIELKNPEKATVNDLKLLLEENGITTVVHIAGIVGEHKVSWDQYFEVNVLWTKNLALAFLKAKISHNKFIFTSTVGVYGTIPSCLPASEDAPYNPDGNYHKSKMFAEKELLKLKSSSNLPLIILRPTTIYGNSDRGFLYKLFRLADKRVFPLSNGNPDIHMLDVESLSEVYATVINQQNPKYDILNVADEQAFKMKELLDYAKTTMGARYLAVPSWIFSFGKKLLAFNRQYSISLKLISESRFYNVEKLHEVYACKQSSTIKVLVTKYSRWYGAGKAG